MQEEIIDVLISAHKEKQQQLLDEIQKFEQKAKAIQKPSENFLQNSLIFLQNQNEKINQTIEQDNKKILDLSVTVRYLKEKERLFQAELTTMKLKKEQSENFDINNDPQIEEKVEETINQLMQESQELDVKERNLTDNILSIKTQLKKERQVFLSARKEIDKTWDDELLEEKQHNDIWKDWSKLRSSFPVHSKTMKPNSFDRSQFRRTKIHKINVLPISMKHFQNKPCE